MFRVSYGSCDKKEFTDTFLIFSYGEILTLKFATVKVFELIFKSVFFYLRFIFNH